MTTIQTGDAKKLSMSGHQSARMKNDEWLTPPEILKPLGIFDLDPCAPIVRPWPTARRHFTKEDDGLEKTWEGRVFLNPPFGSEAFSWMMRMHDHDNGIALLAARTETKMFFQWVWNSASAICFVRGRPHFHFVDGSRAPFNSGAPICLVSYGERNAETLLACNLGKTILL
jgi:hypothetical protein